MTNEQRKAFEAVRDSLPRNDDNYILSDAAFNAGWQAALSTQAEMLKACKEALWVAHENSKLHNGEKYNVTIQTGEVLKQLQAKGY